MIAMAIVSVFLHTETDRNTRKTWEFIFENWEKGGYFGLGTGPNIGPWCYGEKALERCSSFSHLHLLRDFLEHKNDAKIISGE